MSDTAGVNMKYLTNLLGAAVRQELGSLFRANFCLRVAVVSAVAAGFFIGAAAQGPMESPHSGLINSAAAAFNSATGKGYVVDSDGSSIEVSNDRTGAMRSVKVGAHPVSIAVNSQNSRAYVVNAGDGTVSVLDGASDQVVATLQVGDHPYSIASDSAAGRIYVTRTYSNQLMVIDTATNQVSSIEAGSPDLLVVDQKSHAVYLLSYEMGDLAILNGVTGTVTRTSVGMHAWGMAINQATGAVYIAKPGDGQVAVIEARSTHPAYIETGGLPCAVAVNERTNAIYVADYSEDSVRVISGDKRQVVAIIPVGSRPEAVAVDADHDRVFAANTIGASVSVIDGATNSVVRTEPVGAAPYAITTDSSARKVHVALLGVTRSRVVTDY
jgi:YVTN family beta-propeller protein